MPSVAVKALAELARLEGKDASSCVRNILITHLDNLEAKSRVMQGYMDVKGSEDSIGSN